MDGCDIEDLEGFAEDGVEKSTGGGVQKWRKELRDMDQADMKAAKDKHTAHIARLVCS